MHNLKVTTGYSSTYAQLPMKVQLETAVPRRKFVASDNEEAPKTATGHSCKSLCAIVGHKPITL